MNHRSVLSLTVGGSVCIAFGFSIGFAVASRKEPTALAAEAEMLDGMKLQTSDLDGHAQSKSRHGGDETSLENDAKTARIVSAVSQAIQQPNPFDEAQLLAIIGGLSKDEFPIFLRTFRNAKSGTELSQRGGGPLLWTMFWQRFGEVDPASALSNALSCGDLTYPSRDTLEKHCFTGMARNDPKIAADFWVAHPELPNRNRAAEGLLLSWGPKDIDSALSWARQNLTGDDLALGIYAATWGISNGLSGNPDIQRGISFAQSLQDEAERKSALNSLRSLIVNRPQVPTQDILDYVKVTRALGSGNPQVESQVAARSVSTDPQSAAEFFSQPSDGDGNNYSALRSLTSAWVQKDRSAAETWVSRQEGTPYFAILIEELAKAAKIRGDATEAKRLMDSIGAERSK